MLGKDLIDRPQMWQLVLEVGASALSVVAFSTYEHHALIYEHIEFDKNVSSALRALEDAVYDNPMLLLDFKRVIVLYDTQRMAVLPAMAASGAELCIRRMFPPAGSRSEVLTCNVEGLDACVAFEVPADILGFLRRTFHNADIWHPLAPAASYFGVRHTSRPRGKTLVNITGNRLDVVTLGDGAPLVLNSFRFVEPMDAVYYILASRSKLGLRDTDEIMISGDRMVRAAISPVLRRYVRYVMPAIFPSAMFRAGKASLSAPFEMIVAPLI
ncbi:MAG: DUF3822 family protein [Muribaculaceae bacterium]|nr:DUF3822 family protein [Muribaculaceae bacterium]